MPRGGKRDGAGRKSRLSGTERVYCWEQCETLWRESERRAEQAYWNKAEPFLLIGARAW
jgi:hypothetical protein